MDGAQEHPSLRFVSESLDGVTVRSAVPDRPFYKVVQDKDGQTYAQGVRLQTDKVERANRRLQAFEVKEMDIQTEGPGDGGAEAEAMVDEEQLARFLQEVAPVMEQELQLAWRSLPVFDAYVPVWDDVAETCEMTHQVWKEGLVDLQVTSVAWNSTGATLACAFGKLDTLGWCEVTAPVCLWNIFRPQLVAGEPDTVIQVQGFVMCVAFHPTKPSILAGGTYNGELQIWNTGSGELDPLVASSSIDDYFHREAIQVVEWIPADLSGSHDAWLIATVSGDGKVLLWDARDNDLSQPSRGFMLQGSKKRILGGRSLSFSPVDPWLFVVGTETGNVIRAFRPPPGASMGKPTGSYTWRSSAVQLLDQLAANARLQLQHHVENYCRTAGLKEVSAEVIFQSKPDPAILFPAPKTTDLEPHYGPVTVAAFSPFHRKLLLTGAADGSVKIFDVLQQRAIHTFYPPCKYLSACAVSAGAWSSARPCVFAVAMEMGGVFIYDLLQSRQEPVLELPLGSGRVNCVAFNPKQRGMLACGDDGGRVRVFRLPFRLSEQQKSEMSFISDKLMGEKGRDKGDKGTAPSPPPPPPPPPPS
ncbi:unnamed protein product [Effrenium voratum]|uniref:Uncharacterized protein n=1 Tax=Effrenium voratum TaxID=2562239 RepID=A0AA36NH51_9DINO|nr:unnamed protein product [Effrenium voratum]